RLQTRPRSEPRPERRAPGGKGPHRAAPRAPLRSSKTPLASCKLEDSQWHPESRVLRVVVVDHPQSLHDAPRGDILGFADTDDLLEAKDIEAEAERSASGFSRQSSTPVIGVEAPA